MEAIVLAGGLGTRLRSVVSEVPKCMAPVGGRPFLEYLLNILKSAGVSRVIFSVGYLREAVIGWVEEHDFPFECTFAVEEEPLGTGGGIMNALAKAREDDVLVLNGDTFFNADLRRFMAEHIRGGATVSLALKPMTDFDRYGKVSVGADGKVLEFAEKRPCRKGLINGGIYALKRQSDIFRNLPKKFSFEEELLKPLSAAEMVKGYSFDSYFIDIGIPADYSRAQKELPEVERIMKVAMADFAGFDTLLLDRDGVINRLRPNDYVKSWSEFEFMPGVLDALRIFAGKFIHIFIVTNQRGVGKGLMTEADLENIHEKMLARIAEAGSRIDRIYCCTAVSEEDPMRKPNPGMFHKIIEDCPDVRPESTVMIGDSDSDMQFAANCGIRGIKI
jgi:D-glycero-alpha-D-manno-heptose 1-phosphate guanylyltransferase